MMPEDQAHILFLRLDLTAEKWEVLRSELKSLILLPCYKTLMRKRDEILPSIHNDDLNCTVTLSEMVENTTLRTLEFLDESKPEKLINLKSNKLKVKFKFGGDGSGSHSMFSNKQTLLDGKSSTSIYNVGCVLLRIETIENELIYENEKPNSALMCRNISLSYQSESHQAIVDTFSDLQEQADNLLPIQIKIGEKTFEIQPNNLSEYYCTMYDTKAINPISNYIKGETKNLSTSSCYVCGESKKNFMSDNIWQTNDQVDSEMLKFGPSPLHTTLRAGEWLMNTGIKCQIDAKVAMSSTQFRDKKLEVQKQYAEQLKIRVFHVKPGFGSSNTGNVCRSVLKNSQVSSDILGIEKNTIDRLDELISMINSQTVIENAENIFHKKAQELFQILKNSDKLQHLTLTPTVHRLICHGHLYFKQFPVAVGQISESAIEHSHQLVKKFRANHAFKGDLNKNLCDIAKRMLYRTDPYFVLKSMAKENQ